MSLDMVRFKPFSPTYIRLADLWRSPCWQIVQSCVFALFESFCADDEEEDESFAYPIETTSFRLPDVRFSYGTLFLH
jgi:hypothetical protein